MLLEGSLIAFAKVFGVGRCSLSPLRWQIVASDLRPSCMLMLRTCRHYITY